MDSMIHLRIRDIMTKEVVSVTPNTPLKDAEEMMRVRHIRHIPVVGENKILLGILSERDILNHVSPRKTQSGMSFAPEDMEDIQLRQIMTINPATLKPDDEIIKAVEILAHKKYGCMPVVENGKLEGMLSPIDILRVLFKAMQEGDRKE